MTALVFLLILCFAALPAHAQATQRVTLRTGFSFDTQGVEANGATLVLHTGGGQIVVERGEVERIEDLPWVESPSQQVAFARSQPPVNELLRRSAARQGLPAEFVQSVAEVESALKTDAMSPKGARGVMQLMPSTAAALGVNPDVPEENIDGGAKLLRDLLLRYQNHPDQVRLALAAYNAGAGAVTRYAGIPPYRETTAYVERVLRRYRVRQASSASESTTAAGGPAPN
ncbi:MAG: lytic transglycosylase domain-containing protein [Bryobacterales bacterium]|nr:lytic transglycosylase domain-containing protein [Bryobacterales bacterium]